MKLTFLKFLVFSAIAVQIAFAAPHPQPWLGNFWDDVSSKADGVWVDIKNAAEDAAKDIANKAEGAWIDTRDAIKDAASDVGNKAEGVWIDARDAVKGAANDVANTAEGVWNDVKNAAEDAANSGKKIGSDIFDTIKLETENLIKKAGEHGEAFGKTLEELVTQGVHDFTSIVNEFSDNLVNSFNEITNDLKRKFVEEVINILEAIKNTTNDLEALVPKIHNTLSEEIMQQTITTVSGWQEWAEKKLEQVRQDTNDDVAKVDEAKQILYELLDQYSHELGACSNEVLNELKDFENHVKNAVSTYREATDNLIYTVQECLGSDDSENSLTQCSLRALKFMEPLRKAPKEFIILQASGISLITSGLTGTGCAFTTLTQFAVAKSNASIRLKAISQ